jgi:hypothetical protein
MGEVSGDVTLGRSRARCLGPRDFEVDLAWTLTSGAARGRAQVLEVSLLRHDFDDAHRRYRAELAPGVESHRFRAPLAGETVYHWRLRLPAADGAPELVTGTASFVTPSCPGADFER